LETAGYPRLVLLGQGEEIFCAENLDVTIDQGDGSAATVTRVMSGAYDASFGDINAIIQNAATKPAETPVMVYMITARPLRPADQGGRSDQEREGPWRLKARFTRGQRFVQTAAAAGQTKWRRPQQDQHHAGLAEPAGADADSGQVDSVAVFTATSYINLVSLKLDPDKDFRWMYYSDLGLDLYSNGVMVSPKLAREHPEAVRGLLRAINRSLRETGQMACCR